MAVRMPNTAMDGCSGFSPDHHTASISNIQLVCGLCPPGQSVQKGESTPRRSQQKSCSDPIQGRCSRFSAIKKPQVPYLQTLVFLPHLSSSPGLRIPSSHTAFSGFPNDRLSSNVGASTHPVAVPSGILTRFSILLRGCYRIRRHSNGIFTCELSIHD